MNKNRVNNWLLPAREAIVKCGISKDGKAVNKTFRGQISSFGAAVVMGSLQSAVAFFADKGGASVQRDKLIEALYFIINDGEKKSAVEVFSWLSESKEDLKDQFEDASIALKLALNFFELTEEKEKTQNGED